VPCHRALGGLTQPGMTVAVYRSVIPARGAFGAGVRHQDRRWPMSLRRRACCRRGRRHSRVRVDGSQVSLQRM
jgi:hypothetical protein